MKFLGLLRKIESKHDNVRTEYTEGVFNTPVVGEDFVLHGKGLVFGTRIIRTTPVTSVIQKDHTFEFTTMNSTYKVYIEEEMDIKEEDPNQLVLNIVEAGLDDIEKLEDAQFSKGGPFENDAELKGIDCYNEMDVNCGDSCTPDNCCCSKIDL